MFGAFNQEALHVRFCPRRVAAPLKYRIALPDLLPEFMFKEITL